jgi:D-alanine-D-alanine ligase
VYDNLNKSLFEPVPIFVDSHRNFVLLDWQYIYKGTIRDFFPPVDFLPPSPHQFQIYAESLGLLSEQESDALCAKVGRRVSVAELPGLIDFAFLALHGNFGEDGQVQGLLESLAIPYTGSGIRASAIGMDKAFQKKMMSAGGFACPEVLVLDREAWLGGSAEDIFAKAKQKLGKVMVVRPANQGSSIGVVILDAQADVAAFAKAVNRAFFREEIEKSDWLAKTDLEKVNYLRELTDIRDGLGFPLRVQGSTIYHPEALLDWMEQHFAKHETSLTLESHLTEQRIILESFIQGKEFSCIVIRNDDGHPVALPPTEIRKGKEVFDYRSKYLPGLSRKVTPIELPEQDIERIRLECERLFDFFEFNTYARIDGFFASGADGRPVIYLNDPNTTSGMLPSSFFFHQAAEIGLNPSQFLTYIIRTSIWERIRTSTEVCLQYDRLLDRLNESVRTLRTAFSERKEIAVIMGGYSFERHISVESGRNVFEKLSSSDHYEPLPIFLMRHDAGHVLYQIPINLLLKDNADDIRDKILGFRKHPAVERIKEKCRLLTEKYASHDVVFEPRPLSYSDLAQRVAGAFIALHGRPGEDGEVQRNLDQHGIPYNGSSARSAQITIDKFETLRLLRSSGFTTANQLLVSGAEFESDPRSVIRKIEQGFDYPLVAKPVDDGCSSAVKVIRTRPMLEAFLRMMFRPNDNVDQEERLVLNLKPKEEFPVKEVALIESLIAAEGAAHFLEITGGMLTHAGPDGEVVFEVFEPSEALASGEVLSLEEKFLAGEGQNITPARFSKNPREQERIATCVKKDLQRAAQVVGVTGYCRIDAFVRIFDDGRVETIIIEVNSLPGMTPATCIYHQAAINGYKPYDFIDKILEFGFYAKTTRATVG